MIKILRTIKSRLIWAETILCGILMLAMTIVIGYGIFERFVIRQGIGWTDELSRYLSIWAIFFGAGIGVVRGAHVGVEVFVHMLPQRYQDWAMRLSMFVCTLFMGSMAVVAFKYFIRLTNSGQITPAMQIPMSWAFLAVPVGCAFMCIHFLLELLLPKEADNG